MKRIIAATVAIVLFSTAVFIVNAQSNKACTKKKPCCAKSESKSSAVIIDRKPLVCKLSSNEVLERKSTVIADLKKEILERKELPNGYSFKFKGDDASVDRLVAFVKSERQCCGFFTYTIAITEEFAQLELTGPEGAKAFVSEEMGL